MKIDSVTLHQLRLHLKGPFTTSFGTIRERDTLLIQLHSEGLEGWGESAVLPVPFYNEETPTTALHILKDFAIPLLFKHRPPTPEALHALLEPIRGHRIAKAGLEMAMWDLAAQRAGLPLFRLLAQRCAPIAGAAAEVRNEIPVGVSIGIAKDTDALLDQIAGYLQAGYARIKIKIGLGFSPEILAAVFSRFPNLPLMVDANAAFTLTDKELFVAMDPYPLLMIEQPLRDDDIVEHAELQRAIRNPLCLDESIHHAHHAAAACRIEACRIINIKPGRVGGLTESLKIHDVAAAHGIPVWCGGMLESGIGRAINMAIATLPNFKLPGDISASDRYYDFDIVSPEIKLTPRGTLIVPETPGIGFAVVPELLERVTVHRETIRA